MAKVVATRKGTGGDLIAFKLDDGRELNFGECVTAIHNKEIEGLMVVDGKTRNDGSIPLVIRSYGDGDPTNNLSNLPNF